MDGQFGIPVIGSGYSKDPHPKYPMDGNSYEAYDPVKDCPMEGIFVAGWSRQASTGLVGVARRDGTMGAKAVLQYLQTLTPLDKLPLKEIEQRLTRRANPVFTKTELAQLELIEHQQAEKLGLEEFKFSTNQEMLSALGLLAAPLSGKDTSFG